MKTKKTFLNILTDVVPLIIISILGIYKVKLFLRVLGSETLGLYQLFNNIMVYVAIVDGGLTSALLYSLYKPNSSNEKKKFNELLSGGLRTFSKIGMYVFGIAALVSFFIILLIKDSPFSYWYIVLTFILFSLSNVIEYFFVPYNALLEVKEKKYIYNIITQTGQVVLSIVEIVLLLLDFKFVFILISHSVIRIIAKLIEVYVCKKEFPDVNVHEERKDYSFKKYLSSLIVHKVNGLIGSNIDSLIISSMLGLNAVAIYSTYNYIITMLKNILGKISSSMIALVGNSLESNKNGMYDLYLEFNSMLFYIAIIICTPLILAINGFIDIFYEGKIATTYAIAVSFSAILFTFIVKMATNLFVSSGGLYKETRHCAVVDASINLALSLSLVHFIGISGVLLATAISVFIAEYTMKCMVVHKHSFNKSSKAYFIKNIKFFIMYFLDLLMGYFIIKQFTINTLGTWFLTFLIFTILNALLILLIFKLFKETKFVKRVKVLFKKA